MNEMNIHNAMNSRQIIHTMSSLYENTWGSVFIDVSVPPMVLVSLHGGLQGPVCSSAATHIET